MKKPKQSDLTWNTGLATVVSALCYTNAYQFLSDLLFLTITYSAIDYFLGKWE